MTERLKLRPLQTSDAGLTALYASDRRLAEMTSSIPHPYPPGAAQAFIRHVLENAGNDLVWAIDHLGSSDGHLVGEITLRADGDLGYWIGAPFWSTGFATEAVDAVVGFSRTSGIERLRAQVFQDNPASAKVLTKAGFAYVGDGVGVSAARGTSVPLWIYTREETA